VGVNAKAVGPREPRFSQLQHAAQNSSETFQIEFDAVYKQMKACSEAFEVWKKRGGEKTDEDIADYWRRNSARFRVLSSQFGALKSESEQMDTVSQRIVAKAEERMGEWPLTRWLQDHGICVIL